MRTGTRIRVPALLAGWVQTLPCGYHSTISRDSSVTALVEIGILSLQNRGRTRAMSSKRISSSWLLPHGTLGLILWKEKASTSLLNLLFPLMKIAKTRCRKLRPSAPASTTVGTTLRTSRARRSFRGKRGPGKSVLTSLMRERPGAVLREGCAKGQWEISCRPATRHWRVGGCDQNHGREIRGGLSPSRLVWAHARAPYS